ncbi:MAG: outer membrane lipoprotein LolB [Gammaproteobacteria bacterium]|nr:outer membrane lipoprotein LolB [Gammaproteobacteria bacterium]
MTRRFLWPLLLATCAILNACSSLMRTTVLPVMLPDDWEARRGALQVWPRFELRGRVAVARGDEGFTASLRWAQREVTSQVEVDGPLGVGGLHLEFEHGRLDDELARADFEQRLGFSLPVDSLRYWLLGVPDPAHDSLERIADGYPRLDSLQQQGWTVVFPAYAKVSGVNYELPQRIEATREGLRLRLLVESWGASTR